MSRRLAREAAITVVVSRVDHDYGAPELNWVVTLVPGSGFGVTVGAFALASDAMVRARQLADDNGWWLRLPHSTAQPEGEVDVVYEPARSVSDYVAMLSVHGWLHWDPRCRHPGDVTERTCDSLGCVPLFRQVLRGAHRE